MAEGGSTGGGRGRLRDAQKKTLSEGGVISGLEKS